MEAEGLRVTAIL